MLYGKWRPKGFAEVVGQDHIVRTLKNALATGRIAHAYLFSGPRGTGKTTTARILARAVNCSALQNGEPCNQCESCRAILSGSALDLIEMDAASNRGIDDVRELREKIAYAPSGLARKVYLLDEVHMLTEGAFNALLKTLEEPPPHAIFILATTDLHKVPATIISRCQRYDFHRVPNEAIVRRLAFICEQEGCTVPQEGLHAIAVQSRGGLRDAITILEQVIARYGNAPTVDDVRAALGQVSDARVGGLVRALLESHLAAALDIARSVADDGIDIARFTRSAVDLVRDLLAAVLRDSAASNDDELLAVARSRADAVPLLASALAELARADFRLDPASPVPLEVACASVILGPPRAALPVAAAPAAVPGQASEGGRRPARQPSPPPADPGPMSREEKFARELYEHCKIINPALAMWLNGSFDVLQMDGDELVLGFQRKMPMEKVDTACRPMVEEQAAAILGRPVRLRVQLVEATKQANREPRRGHLAEAAKKMGARPIGKDS
ncbi:DNA polymerase III subunit gamma/tau [Tepidiforma sp.]|uniref:DNA polymerase III subunit gamma/tau n=1 Tax=Tepidiforma sp. TaxID=2682230 RepID=UPI002ADDE85A|nr:DNA polymerase III subunit gamma/tau [Tepidiforma sp.]